MTPIKIRSEPERLRIIIEALQAMDSGDEEIQQWWKKWVGQSPPTTAQMAMTGFTISMALHVIGLKSRHFGWRLQEDKDVSL